MLQLRSWLALMKGRPHREAAAAQPVGTPLLVREWPTYAWATVICLILLVPLLRLNRVDIHVPFMYSGDGLYYLALLSGIVENGWYLDNPRLGFPGGLNYRDFPVSDGWLHLGIVKVIGAVVPDPAVVFNVFFLLTFPLTALTGVLALRRLGAAHLPAILGALLFTFLPYHFFRLPHLFLAAYYLVPIGVLLAIRVYQGQGGWTRARFAAAVLIGFGGVYFAFFTLIYLAVGAMAGAAAGRSWRPLKAGALWGAVIVGSVGITLAPSIHYKLTTDANADSPKRAAFESETLALKITQLVLPVTNHRVGYLRDLKEHYNHATVPAVTDNDMSSLGLVGALGFIGLLLWLFARSPAAGPRVVDGLMLLSVASLLLATLGGFGSLMAYLASPWIRGYSRISICIGFFSLAAVALALTWAQVRWATTPRRQRGFAVGVIGLLVLGLLDQTTPAMAPRHRELKADYDSDRAFAHRIEESTGPGGAVFQLPYRWFPECPPEAQFNAYDLFRPYLHTRQVRWGYGGMRGHVGDIWSKEIAALPAEMMVDRLAEAGVAGIYIDRNGYADRAAAIEQTLASLLGEPPWVSDNGRASYFDLGGRSCLLRERCSSDEWRRRQERALHPVLVLWRNGFGVEEKFPDKGVGHWCSGSGELHLLNELAASRRVTLRWHCDLPGRTKPARLRIDSPGGSSEVQLDPKGHWIDQTFEVPPGGAILRLACDAPRLRAPEDVWRRRLVMRVSQVSCLEYPPSPE